MIAVSADCMSKPDDDWESHYENLLYPDGFVDFVSGGVRYRVLLSVAQPILDGCFFCTIAA